MNKNFYIFIGQIIAAMKGNKPYFVSKSTRATYELAAVFSELNIIKKITNPSNKIIRNMPKTFRNKYKIFWLNSDYSPTTNKLRGDPKRSDWVKNRWFYNKITIIKPRMFYKNVISYKELIDSKPFKNTIYILQTPRGIISSKEAIRYKLGGFIICIIHLLCRFFIIL